VFDEHVAKLVAKEARSREGMGMEAGAYTRPLFSTT